MTNSCYRYPGYELWDDKEWEGRLQSPFYPMVQWIGALDTVKPRAYGRPVDGLTGEACRTLSCYTKKTNSVAAPDVTAYWEERGMFYTIRSLGGVRWMIFAPLSAMADHVTKLRTLVTYHQEDYSDPYWAMKTLEDHEELLNMAAEDKNMILMFFITQGPEKGGYFVEILQEASTCFPIDTKRLFLNVALIKDKGLSIKDAPGYTYTDADGNAADPDAAVAPFGALGIPALDISGRWPSLYSLNRKQILLDDFSSALYDRERMLHSKTAERMMEGIAMDHDFRFADEPDFAEYWDRMGLKFEIHYTKGERWMTFTPRASLDRPAEELPLMVVMQEVGEGNPHLAVTSINYFFEAVKLAAQGEFIALFFVLEDPDSNELLREILEEAGELYPVDRSRMYIMGHSHNGMYSHEFCRNNPTLMAGAATMGNAPGLKGVTGTAPGTDDTDEKVERESRYDVPVIDMVGTCEMNIYFPVAGERIGRRTGVTGSANDHVKESIDEQVEQWQRRLRAMNCPIRTKEEILASLESPDTATRFLGFPADRTDILYLDGVDHYIGDIKNNDGKYHFRVVGIDNLPHLPSPSMIDLAWSFLKRFKRAETGEIVELY